MRISEEKNIINKPTRCNMEMNQDTLEKMLGMNLKGIYYAFKTSEDMYKIILGGAGVYDKLVDFAGAGATVPLTGFGNTLAKGVREAVKEQGILGALTGGLKASAAGIAAAVFFGFLAALLCNPKDKS